MFGNRGRYGFGMPRRRIPPEFHQRGAMMRHMHDAMYFEEITRREREVIAMEEMLLEDTYMNSYHFRAPLLPHPQPMMTRFPMGQGVPDWRTHHIRNTIRMTQQRILASKAVEEGTNSTAQNTETAESSKSNGIPAIVKVKDEPTDSKQTIKMLEEPLPLPIGPRIPAKQMWESSYRDVVSEEQETKLQESLPEEAARPQKSQQPKRKRRNKHNFRNKKFQPYSKKRNKNKVENPKIEEFPRTCQVCDIELLNEDQERTHEETEDHKLNITNGDKKAMNTSLEKLNETTPLPTNTPECTKWGKDNGDRSTNTIHFCRLCSVRMTSLQHAYQHYAGKAHAKRIRIVQRGHKPHRKRFTPTQFVSGGVLGLQGKKASPSYSLTTYGYGGNTQPANQIMQQTTPTVYQAAADSLSAPGTSCINLKPSLPGNFANSMTPSGQYYCSTCNVVIEHAGNLNSHLQSKAHKQAKAMA